ncbi:MAG: LytTR family DNA-binding domain-containing protein [Rubricoccaceae bacterium]|nr:LytTR family DNA-binding domain-containing protein [Rubricoccaceae bacterium]
MIRALIVDDEAPARKRLARLLAPLADEKRVVLAGDASDGVQALQILNDEEIDLLFLDIQMPEMDGFDVLDRIPPDNRPAIIFTTAFDQYALKAFEANAVDYLLKPIEAARLEESISRVENMQRVPAKADDAQDRLADLLEFLDKQALSTPKQDLEKEYLQQISVPGRDRLIILSVEELISAEVHDGITQLFTVSNGGVNATVSRHIVSHTLDALEQRLNPENFMRVHRSALVQLSHIREMISWFSGRYKLVLSGGHEVIASRARSKELKDRLSL